MSSPARVGCPKGTVYPSSMGRRRRAFKNTKNRPSQSNTSLEVFDPAALREVIGNHLYDRIMQWNDSGAAEAWRAAQTRRMARERGSPFWVPKMKSDMYISPVEWDKGESGDVWDAPGSAVAMAEEGVCVNSHDTDGAKAVEGDKEDRQKELPHVNTAAEESHPFTWGEADAQEKLPWSSARPTLVDAVLEDSDNGVRLLVGGQPVEPSGWGEDVEAVPSTSYELKPPSTSYELKPLEAVLEDFEDGKRLLVGGWPVKPSWDQPDTDWLQPGRLSGVHDSRTVESCLEKCHFLDPPLRSGYQSTGKEKSRVEVPASMLGWHNSFHARPFMAAR